MICNLFRYNNLILKMTFTGYVYKITGACGLVYIGSTIDFKRRKCIHNSNNSRCSSKLLKKPLHFDIIDTREYTLIKTLKLMEQFYLDNNNTINQKRAYTNYKSLAYLLIDRTRSINYYKKNKEKISQKQKEKIKCVCGCLISRRNLSKHKKTKNHIKLLNLLNSSV